MSMPPMGSLILPGLVSVTFRQFPVDEIVEIAARNSLHAIEWGADLHCPPGDIATARRVESLTAGAGLESCAYGSYYRAGESPAPDFAGVLETACILRAPLIRVWAGRAGSANATPDYRKNVEDDLRRISELAVSAGCRISLECHSRTLTDTSESALSLLRNIPSLFLHWQPPNGIAQPQALDFLAQVGARLSNLHVFAWESVGEELIRLPLAEHANRWKTYLECASEVSGRRYALLEFVRNDSVDQLTTDARTLSTWLQALR